MGKESCSDSNRGADDSLLASVGESLLASVGDWLPVMALTLVKHKMKKLTSPFSILNQQLNSCIAIITKPTRKMASQKSYLEFSPPGNPGQLFPGSNVPVDVRHTPSRREHLRAYFAFMRPEVTHLMNRYGQLATENICKALYESGKRAVPSQGFELMVDRSMWRLWCKLPFSHRLRTD